MGRISRKQKHMRICAIKSVKVRAESKKKELNDFNHKKKSKYKKIKHNFGSAPNNEDVLIMKQNMS